MKAKATPENIFYFAQGNLRYRLYYSIFRFIMRPHIREQIAYRIKWMNSECYSEGSCQVCGCATTALQMANKICDGYCYPPMMSRSDWKKYKLGSGHYVKNGYWVQEKYIPIKDQTRVTDKPIFYLKINEEYVRDNNQRTGDGYSRS